MNEEEYRRHEFAVEARTIDVAGYSGRSARRSLYVRTGGGGDAEW